MATSVEQALNRAKAKINQNPKPNPAASGHSVPSTLKESLALVADTQYQNGLDLINQVSDVSFNRGISEGLELALDGFSQSKQSEIIDAIVGVTAKRLKAATPQSAFILPASEWVIEGDDDATTD